MKRLKVLDQEMDVKISPSFLKTAMCPAAMRLKYIERVTDRYVRVASLRGSAAHEAIADLTRIAVEEEIPLVELSNAQIDEAVHKHTPHEILSELGDIHRWVRLWRARFELTPHYYGHEEKIALGENLEETSWDSASYRSVLDFLEINNDQRVGIITDYKSHYPVLSESDLRRHEQLSFYAWILSKLHPRLESFVVRIYYLRHGITSSTVRTMDDVMEYDALLRLQERKILDVQNWDPIPGDQCGLCDFIHRCPLAVEQVGVPDQIITQAQAEEMAGYLRVMEMKARGIKTKLRSYVKDNDAVRLPGNFVYGFRATEGRKWSLKELEVFCTEQGMDFLSLVQPDRRALKKLTGNLQRRGSDLADVLLAASQPEVRTTFEGRVVTDAGDEPDELNELGEGDAEL